MLFRHARPNDAVQRALRAAVASHRPVALRALLASHGERVFARARYARSAASASPLFLRR